jgi:hypothetical protein
MMQPLEFDPIPIHHHRTAAPTIPNINFALFVVAATP